MLDRRRSVSLAHAFDDASLAAVSTLIDVIADDDRIGVPMVQLRAAQLACNHLRRLTRIAECLIAQVAAGELTAEHARDLNGDSLYDVVRLVPAPATLRSAGY
jgi:hypothetical protein